MCLKNRIAEAIRRAVERMMLIETGLGLVLPIIGRDSVSCNYYIQARR